MKIIKLFLTILACIGISLMCYDCKDLDTQLYSNLSGFFLILFCITGLTILAENPTEEKRKKGKK